MNGHPVTAERIADVERVMHRDGFVTSLTLAVEFGVSVPRAGDWLLGRVRAGWLESMRGDKHPIDKRPYRYVPGRNWPRKETT